MTCEETVGLIYEYLDKELDGNDHTKIKQHLGKCNTCCEKFEFEQDLKEIVKNRLRPHKISENVREIIVSQLSARQEEQEYEESYTPELEESKKIGFFQRLTLRPVYLAAAILLPLAIAGLSIYIVFFKTSDYFPIIKGVAERHDKLVSTEGFLDSSKPDLGELKRYFDNYQHRVNLSTNTLVKNDAIGSFTIQPGTQNRSSAYEVNLLGCKNCSLAGRKSVYVGLERSPTKISLEVVDGSGIEISGLKKELFEGRPYYSGKHKGYNIILWKHGNTLYSLTSTMHKNELMRVANGTIKCPHE